MRALKRYGWAGVAVAAAALLLWLALRSPDRQQSLVEYQAAGTMRQIATDDVANVEVVAGARRRHFERRAGAWQGADAATGAAIETGLRLLHNTPPERGFEVAAPEFGLDRPALQVQLQTADGRRFEADFGATNPIGMARYVRVRSGGVVTLQLLPAYVAEAWEQVAAARDAR